MARAVLAGRVRALRGGSHWRGVQVSVCRWARASGAACRGGVLDWRVWWGWRRLRQGAAGARAQALGLCLQVTGQASWPPQGRASGLLTHCAGPICLPCSHVSFLVGHVWPRSPRRTSQRLTASLPPWDPAPSRPPPHPASPLCSIRQYELVVHTDIDAAKVYVGEMGRLKSYENQKP